MCADARCRSVDCADDGLLAIHDRSDEALSAALDVSANIAEHLGRSIGRAGVHRDGGDAKVGAGAEVTLASSSDDDATNVEVVRRAFHKRNGEVALIGGDGIGRIGAIEGERGHAVVGDLEQDVGAENAVGIVCVGRCCHKEFLPFRTLASCLSG